jgi:hypothetical protein
VKKEFVFSAKFDTADFDRSVQEMQKKLKDLYAPADMARMQRDTAQRMQQNGMGGIMSAPSVEAYRKATQQSRREIDQMISEQAKAQERLGKIIAQRSEVLKKMQDQQKQMVKDSKEELDIKEKIARVESNLQQQREAYRQRDAAMNQSLDARESLKPQGMERLARAYQGGGIMGAAKAGYRMASPGAILGAVGTGAAWLGGTMVEGANMYRDMSMAPVRTESAMGSAVNGSLGRAASDIYNRRSPFELMFSAERARAARQALETMSAAQTADKWSLGGTLLKGWGQGVAGGAATGATIGGVVGGIGGFTAGGAAGGVGAIPGAIAGAAGGAKTGALIGAGVGGIYGAGRGIWGALSDERQRALMLSPFSETQRNRYNSMLASDMVNAYNDSYEGQKKQNPFKTAAVGEYEQNWQRNLDMQRGLGLNNSGFYGRGGYMEGAIGAGFTPEMAMQMGSGILGSGGSTQMARNATFGLQMERGMDLTNANQILGTLSGSLGSSESTKQATVKILAEGMKLGLDDSKFAEENRRFTQMTAEIIARSGARSDSDQERISGGFGRFVGENTNAGISAAKTAYEQYQQISQTTTGPRGVMRAAGFLSDPSLRKLSTMTKQGLMAIREDELTEDHPVVEAAAKEAGISSKELISRVSGTTSGAVSRFKQADQLRDKIKSYAKNIGKERLTEEDIRNAPEDVRNDFNKLTTFQTTELGPMNRQQTISRALGTINPAEALEGKQLGRENIAQDKLTSIERTGRMEDTTIKAMAADSKVVLDNFNEMAPAMKSAAEATAAWTREVREANAALQQVLEAARQNKNADTYKAVQDVLKGYTQKGTQVQSGKQSK